MNSLEEHLKSTSDTTRMLRGVSEEVLRGVNAALLKVVSTRLLRRITAQRRKPLRQHPAEKVVDLPKVDHRIIGCGLALVLTYIEDGAHHESRGIHGAHEAVKVIGSQLS